MSNLAALQRIFDSLFVNAPVLSAETDASVSDEWDSFMQVQIVLAVEDYFKVRFRLDEIESLTNVGEFVELIDKYIS